VKKPSWIGEAEQDVDVPSAAFRPGRKRAPRHTPLHTPRRFQPPHAPDPHWTRRYLRDMVYGANDGIITTFAVVAGVAGAALSPAIVLILGVANLVADGVSMGASNYLGIRSEQHAKHAEALAAGETPPQPSAALRHGIATFLAFALAGAVPLVAYVVPIGAASRFATATVLTLAALFGVGAARTFATRRPWWTSGLEMLLVGAGAALVAYGAGAVVSRLVR